jgi:hypothetical protein
MAIVIVTKNSAAAGVAPSAGQLVQGELAVNVTDKRLYTLDSSNNVVLISSGSNFNVPVIIDVSSSSAALRVTQRGSGDALLVEDSTNPDSSPFVIDASGNVGIGTTTPTNLLTVAGNANITGNTTLGDASTDTVTVNGRIGIGGAAGTTAGAYLANSALTGTQQHGFFSNLTGASDATAQINAFISVPATSATATTTTIVTGYQARDAVKGAGSTITNLYGVYIIDQTQGTNNYGILSAVSSGTNKWNIYASGTAANYFAGNVLVGTTTSSGQPQIQVQLSSSNGGVGVRVRNTASTGTTTNTIFQLGNDTAEAAGALFQGASTYASFGGANSLNLNNILSAPLTFGTNNTERMRIDSSGNVGIGTSSPATGVRLDTFGGYMRLRSNTTINADISGSTNALVFESSGGTGEHAIIAGGNTSPNFLSFYTANSAAPVERMRIDSAGNVGIGTSSPAAELHLNTGFQVIDELNFAATKFNSQGVTWSSVSTNPSLVFNGASTTRPEISWIRGANTYPEFSIRQHTTANLGGQFWAGSGTAAPALVASVLPGAFLIGTGASQSLSNGAVTGNLQIETANGSTNASMVRNTANANGPIFAFGKSRGAALGSRTIVASGDILGVINFDGADGTNMLDAASIVAQVDGTPGTNDMPGRLVFSTTADGASSPTERMRLDSAGNLGLGVTPSAWSSSYRAEDIGTGGAIAYSSNGTDVWNNAFASSTQNTYKTTNFATVYRQSATGQHQWFTAPSGTAGNAITFTQAMTLDASGNLLVGTTSSRTNAISTGSFLQIESTSSSASPAIVRNSADITGSYVVLGKSRGTSVGSFTAVTSGDQVGGVSFEGADGASLVEAARVQGFADGTVSTGIVPGRLVFSTANTSGSLIERMRITSTGALAINGATSYGTSGQVLTSAGNAPPTWSTPASGTVTSVGFTGGIISVATPTTTPAFTVAGTSGGIPYFSSGTTWASSAALAANALVVGGGAGVAPATTTTGTGVVTALGNAANATGGFATINGTATLTNKRIDPRTSTSASTSSLTPDISSFDQYNLTALAATLAINAPIGTPVDGNKLLFRILDNGTTRTINWNATYTAIGVTLPTATTANKMIYVGCIYNSTNTRWDVVAVTTQA